LERLGCHLVDSKDAVGLANLFQKIEGGAVVYVDDFAGTGNQFCGVRDILAPLIPTTFVEFVIMPAMCEEAYGPGGTHQTRLNYCEPLDLVKCTEPTILRSFAR